MKKHGLIYKIAVAVVDLDLLIKWGTTNSLLIKQHPNPFLVLTVFSEVLRMLRETVHDVEERKKLTASERIYKMKSVSARKQLVNFSLAIFKYCCSKKLKLLNVGEGLNIAVARS